jgi:hypothetical protein
MPKYIIKEGLVTRFLVGIFNAVAAGKKDALMKKLKNDSEFQGYIKKLNDIKNDMEASMLKKGVTKAQLDAWDTQTQL